MVKRIIHAVKKLLGQKEEGCSCCCGSVSKPKKATKKKKGKKR